mgnify:CR=1 FL=1
MIERRRLPERRSSESFVITHGRESPQAYSITLGRYETGEIGEVFASGRKVGTMTDNLARDGAVLLSIALQCGVLLEIIQKALTREEDGYLGTVIGALVDLIMEDKPQPPADPTSSEPAAAAGMGATS